MIVCPNCKHDNPEGATNCEACYTALPATKACPNCGASIQLDATFCGQCGHNLKAAESKAPIALHPPVATNPTPESASVGLPPTVLTSPEADLFELPTVPPVVPATSAPDPILVPEIAAEETSPPVIPATSAPDANLIPAIVTEETAPPVLPAVNTPLQPAARQLIHLQTNAAIEIQPHLQVIHLGKPNDLTPPDIDVSSFPCAEVVSRVHANIRLEGENYYIEDAGSANGTYINHNVLARGNRHLLRPGDRIGLGKGDLVTFIFQAPA
jgi:pSer/pThr/pTyr-binding forkhead associated (FHA) protein/ribosomal protein L40E